MYWSKGIGGGFRIGGRLGGRKGGSGLGGLIILLLFLGFCSRLCGNSSPGTTSHPGNSLTAAPRTAPETPSPQEVIADKSAAVPSLLTPTQITEAHTYNTSKQGVLWRSADLPTPLNKLSVDSDSFANGVAGMQKQAGISMDGQLGPSTCKGLNIPMKSTSVESPNYSGSCPCGRGYISAWKTCHKSPCGCPNCN